MATARRHLVDPAEGGVFHCISRYVRRAYLCGQDPLTGRCFEHRREWVRDRIRELAAQFAVDVFAYSVMSNHQHIILGTDPKRAQEWTDVEVARRWLTLFPGPSGKPGRPPEDSTIQALCQDWAKLALCRGRLSDVSWFMRCLNEPIARRANREDGCTGRFWEERFKCQRLDDAGALLTCMAYVDLNPVRAGLAATPESSDFTSAQDRSVAMLARRQLAAAPEAAPSPTPAQEEIVAQAHQAANRDRWLVAFAPSDEKPAPTSAATWLTGIDETSYLQLLDWTGREIRADKRGHIPASLRPVLERLDLDVEAWAEHVARYGSLFHRLVGKFNRLHAWAQAKKLDWLHGLRAARLLYSQAT
ncbi:MAG: transposase [Verrucomicrobiales bacterium]